MDNILTMLANAMFPNIDSNVDRFEEIYPPRAEKGECVTRFAPSPTGFIHIGGIFVALLNQNIAKHRNGTFILRIEDTDQVRIIENGVSQIVDTLKNFDIIFDEGPINDVEERGKYGPYKQTERREIYQSYAKYMVENGLAYPCFCSADDLDKIRQKQIENKESFIGYGGKDAVCRNILPEEALKRVLAGESFVTRFKAPLDVSRVVVEDLIRGKIETEDNKIDTVIIKSNGLPTYHFAHVVDDHLMRTTHVLRGDEWLSSLPLHLQLFRALGFKPPKYAHISPIDKLDNGSRRKISKRKDPEASVGYFYEEGYPVVAVKEYLYNILNSKFELWRKANPEKPYQDFELKISEMNSSGALFDFLKLGNVAKKIVKTMSDEEIFKCVEAWAKIKCKELFKLIENDKERFLKSIAIWHKNRMDVEKWSDVEKLFKYLYAADFLKMVSYLDDVASFKYVKEILTEFLSVYDENDDEQTWFNKVKIIAEKYNYATNLKEYKENPEKFNGSIVDLTAFLRLAITGKKDSPNIYEIMKFVGKDETVNRIKHFIDNN